MNLCHFARTPLAALSLTGLALAQGSGGALEPIDFPYASAASRVDRGDVSVIDFGAARDLDLSLGVDSVTPEELGFWDVGHYRRDVDALGLGAFLVTAGSLGAVIGTGDNELIRDVGDWTQIIPSVAGGVTSLFEPTWDGTRMFAYSGLTTFAVTQLTKAGVDRWRPDGSDADSFPSGHTSFSFQGASFIGTRYGSRFGLSAYTMAFYTAYSRVQGEKHFFDDVLTGGSLAVFANWLFVDPLESWSKNGGPDMSVQAMSMQDGGFGLGLASRIGPSRIDPRAIQGDVPEPEVPPSMRWRYELEVGWAWTRSNPVRAPEATGTEIDFAEFDNNTNPDVYASASLSMTLHDVWEFMLLISAYELRDSTTFSQPTRFAGQLFAANEPTLTRFLAVDYVASAKRVFPSLDPWIVKAGVSGAISDTEANLINSTTDGVAREVVAIPFVSGVLGYRLSDEFRLVGDIDAGLGPYITGSARVVWQVHEKWDIAVGWRGVRRKIEQASLSSDLRQNRGFLTIAHSF